VDAGCTSLISICFSKIAGAPIGSPQFLASKEESMACALRRYGVTDSGISNGVVEGGNNKAKVAERKPYGFRTIRCYEVALYHALGRLPVPEIAHRFY
jgi:hypothetical protein